LKKPRSASVALDIYQKDRPLYIADGRRQMTLFIAGMVYGVDVIVVKPCAHWLGNTMTMKTRGTQVIFCAITL